MFYQDPIDAETIEWLDDLVERRWRSRSGQRASLRVLGRHSSDKLTLECQGSVVALKPHRTVPATSGGPPHGGGKRGRVAGFSRQSRKRMIDKCARLRQVAPDGQRYIGSRLDLTYPGPESSLPTPEQVKDHWRSFAERLRRAYPQVSAVWRLEFESSGQRDYNPHIHVIAFNLPWVPVEMIRSWWAEIIERENPRVGLAAIRNSRQLMGYVSKYASKVGGYLVHVAYPHADIDPETGEITGPDADKVLADGRIVTGRVWGIHNREFLPFAPLTRVSLPLGRYFFDIKRAARRYWSRCNTNGWAGFTLYTTNPSEWLRVAFYHSPHVCLLPRG